MIFVDYFQYSVIFSRKFQIFRDFFLEKIMENGSTQEISLKFQDHSDAFCDLFATVLPIPPHSTAACEAAVHCMEWYTLL